MTDGYQDATLPLDTPDDDPAWQAHFDELRQGFLLPHGTAESLAQYQAYVRADGERLRQIRTTVPGKAESTPVAVYASYDATVNVGGQLVAANLVTDIAVRASHRRRGLLTRLMLDDLAAARERGVTLASLTASEGRIYGRFGFGVAVQSASIEIDSTRFALRTLGIGAVEYVAPGAAWPTMSAVFEQFHTGQRGSHQRPAFWENAVTGVFDYENEAPNPKLRCAVHYDDAGRPDGYAAYQFAGRVDGVATVDVVDLTAAHRPVEFALLAFLAQLDLVKRVRVRNYRRDTAIRLAVTDPRAVKVTDTSDHIWLRVLDPAAALTARGWEHDGDLRLGVTDPHGFAAGTFALTIRDGVATVEQTDHEPEIVVDAEGLGSLYFGDTSVLGLATAGRAQGSLDALTAAAKLFAVAEAPYCPMYF